MKRPPVSLLVVLLVVASVPLGAAPAFADGFVSVSTTVTPTDPVPEKPFTIEATVANSEHSSTAYRVDHVAVRRGPSEDDELISERRLRRGVSIGETETVPIEATLNDTGLQTVYLHMDLAGSSIRDRHVVHPVEVRVYDPHPQVELSTNATPLGPEQTVSVSVSNGLETPIRNVELLVEGESVDVQSARRVAAKLDPGTDRAFDFVVEPASPATHDVDVTVRYTQDNVRRNFTFSQGVDFASTSEVPERPQVELTVPRALPEETRPVNVSLANGLSQNVRQVTVTVSSPAVNFESTQRVRATLAAGETARFAFPSTVEESGTYPVTVDVAYTIGDTRQEFNRTYQAAFSSPPNPGEITLTGVDAVQRNGRLEVSATASNVGSTDVQSVVVSLGEGGNVAPTDYFVGSVEGSDFASFTLTTGVSGNVSSVPVSVSYVVNGVRRSYTTDVSVERVVTADPRPSGGGGLPGLLPIGIGVVVLVAAGAWAIRRRG